MSHWALAEDNKPTFRPTTFSFSEKIEKTAVLYLYNGQNFPVSWTIEPFYWTQGEDPKLGNDKLTPTDEIDVIPDYVYLPPGDEQSVRITYKGNFSSEVEKSYRIILSSNTIKQNDVAVNYTQSLPIFIIPKLENHETNSFLAMQSNGKISLETLNRGNLHVFMKSMRIVGIGTKDEDIFEIERPGWYLLAGKKVDYLADLSQHDCKRLKSISAVVEFRDGSRTKTNVQGPFSCTHDSAILTGFEGNAEKLNSISAPSRLKP